MPVSSKLLSLSMNASDSRPDAHKKFLCELNWYDEGSLFLISVSVLNESILFDHQSIQLFDFQSIVFELLLYLNTWDLEPTLVDSIKHAFIFQKWQFSF